MKRIAVLAAITSTLAITACGADQTQLDDAPVGIVDDSPTFVITNADQFPNLALRCYEGALFVTTTRQYGDAVNVLPDFEPCADGDPVPDGER